MTVNYNKIQPELQECKPILLSQWGVQGDKKDYDTGFIYYCQTLLQVIELSDTNGVDLQYAVHRWYNYWCSKWAEHSLCKYGATPEPNQKHHDIDVFIDGVPYDVKVTVLAKDCPPNTNLKTRSGKNEYIKWLIENQSKESRYHSANKLYFVCIGDTYSDSQMLKCDFSTIEQCAKRFVEYSLKTGTFNKVTLANGKTINADLIVVQKEEIENDTAKV